MISLDTDALNAIDEGRFLAAQGVVFYFGGGTYAFWNREGSITPPGSAITFEPGGNLLDIGGIQASAGGVVQGLDILLPENGDVGLTPAVLADIENEDYHQRNVEVYNFIFHADTAALLLFRRVFKGTIDLIEHRFDGDGMSLVAKCEDHNLDNTRTGNRFRTNEDQEQVSSGDLIFNEVSNPGNQEIPWGRET